ncbi:hypothetical protein FBU30_006979 [Linnemannia zychae]|nr:hypothetical protein FBU30_006979 [Linnemannia zychae]
MQALGVGGGWKGKATHVGRQQGAFFARMCGAGIEEIAKHGNWSKSRLVTHYLDGVDASVALQMAGFPSGRVDSFWLARGTVLPDLGLKRQLFPFIEAACSDIEDKDHYDSYWTQTIDNIMNDRSIYYGEKRKRRRNPKYLEKMTLSNNSAAKHPIFKQDVFRSSQFLSFKQKIAEALTNASVGSANLATVTPAIQQHISAVNTAVSAINSQQQALSAQFTQYSEQLTSRDRQDQRIQQCNQLINELILQNTTTMNDKLTALIDCVTITLTDALTTLNRTQSPIDANTIQIAEPRLSTLSVTEIESVQHGLGNSTTVDKKSCSNGALSALTDACRLFVTDETLQQQRQSNLLSPEEISPSFVQRSNNDSSTITSEAKAHAVAYTNRRKKVEG